MSAVRDLVLAGRNRRLRLESDYPARWAILLYQHGSHEVRYFRVQDDDGQWWCLVRRARPYVTGHMQAVIRRTAREGDYVLGFAGQDLPPMGRLVYAMRVTDKKSWSEYAVNYHFRADCIYTYTKGRYADRAATKFDCDLTHDLGPDFKNAYVLLSTDFRYFGRCNKVDLPNHHQTVLARVGRLGKGHIRFHEMHLRNELCTLIDYLWKNFELMQICRPTNPRSKRCHRQEDKLED